MKQLPYYKFDVSEWISGAITLESLEAQGAFINICAYYWFKSGCLTLTEIKRRVKCKPVVFQSLIDSNLIKLDQDSISITFLDEQLRERGHKAKINSINGSKGGAPKGNNNAKKAENNKQETTEIQPETSNIEEKRIEEKREEENREEHPPFSDFWFDNIFDELQMESIRSVFREHDIPNEYLIFKLKVRGARGDYIHRDSNGIKQAFIYQLKNSKPNVNRNTNKGKSTGADAILERPKDWGDFD